MKKVLGIAVMLMLGGSAWAQTYTAPIVQRPVPPRARGTPAPLTSRDIGGVVARGVRGGNPAQMLNPRAPARYGTSQQSVMLKPDGSGKWNGIKLFTIYF